MSELRPYQEVVYRELIERYENSDVQLLPAMTGWGKTYLAVHLANYMRENKGMSIMVICPSTLSPMWKSMIGDCVDVLSYEKIRGIRGKEENGVRRSPTINHPWLTRGNDLKGPYAITDEFRAIRRKGLFIIFDESQSAKNDSSQHFACAELVAHRGTKSKVLHLSAAMFAEEKCRPNFFRLMGLMRDDYYQDVIRTADKLNPEGTSLVNSRFNPSKKGGLNPYLREIWDVVFREHYSVKVDDPVYRDEKDREFDYQRVNGFYTLNRKAVAECTAAIEMLKNVHIFKGNTVNKKNAMANIAIIQKALVALAHAKTTDLLRVSLIDLKRYDTCKLVLCVPFLEDHELLAKGLSAFGPLVLNGEVKPKDRANIIAKFNEANTKHRVIIITPQIGGIGVSLHDHNEGDELYPRRMYVVPTFHFLSMFQCAGRIYRSGMRSDAFVSFFYGSNSPMESILVNTMAKGKAAEGIADNGRIFPNQYEIFIEDENYVKHAKLRASLEAMSKK